VTGRVVAVVGIAVGEQGTGTEEWGLGGDYWQGGEASSLALGGHPNSKKATVQSMCVACCTRYRTGEHCSSCSWSCCKLIYMPGSVMSACCLAALLQVSLAVGGCHPFWFVNPAVD
jgi:hypothetical protein